MYDFVPGIQIYGRTTEPLPPLPSPQAIFPLIEMLKGDITTAMAIATPGFSCTPADGTGRFASPPPDGKKVASGSPPASDWTGSMNSNVSSYPPYGVDSFAGITTADVPFSSAVTVPPEPICPSIRNGYFHVKVPDAPSLYVTFILSLVRQCSALVLLDSKGLRSGGSIFLCHAVCIPACHGYRRSF